MNSPTPRQKKLAAELAGMSDDALFDLIQLLDDVRRAHASPVPTWLSTVRARVIHGIAHIFALANVGGSQKITEENKRD